MILGLAIGWVQFIFILFVLLFPVFLFLYGLQSVIDWFNQADWHDVWIGFLRVVFAGLMLFGIYALIFL
jgi:hypothetical protein